MNEAKEPGRQSVMTDVFLGRPDLARRYNVDPKTIGNWVRDGHLPPPRKIGGSYRWPAREIEEFEAQLQTVPA